jgi:hypothetical protein
LEALSFSVSGLQIVKSWLDYCKRSGAGRRSSPLDEIRPERWTNDMTRELLELLWVLEATVALFPELESNLERVVTSDLLIADELPIPTDDERHAPRSLRASREPMLDLD